MITAMQTTCLPFQQALKEFWRQYETSKDKIARSAFVNCLAYETGFGECEMRAEEANELIKVIGLSHILVAMPTTFPTQDSFIVKRKSHEHTTA
jgi:hypothetical protein